MRKQKSNYWVLLVLIVALTPFFNSCGNDDEDMDVEFALPSNLILSNDGSSGIINLALSGNADWSVAAKEGSASWCDITPASGSGKGQFVVTAAPNSNHEARSVELEVTVGRVHRSFTVFQKDTLLVSLPDAVAVANEGATLTIPVEANTRWEIINADRANWIKLAPANGVGKGQVQCVVSANTALRSRAAELVVSAGSISRVITISQQDVAPTFVSDSLALVALYNATDGPYWSLPWDLKKSISFWLGVTTSEIEGQLRVTKLLLTSRNIEGTIPPEIGNITMVQDLDLSNNNIRGSIPEEIGRLTKLKILNITNNKFDGELPLSIKEMVSLEKLSANNNRFKTFPVEICQLPKLRTIYLENNEISSLPGEIATMGSLMYLYLGHNRLTVLSKELGELSTLQYLMVNNNQISELSDELGKLESLVSLNLADNQIASTIPAGISNLTKLKFLNIKHNKFAGGLPADMERMVSLERIEAYDCGLTGPLPELGKEGSFKNLKNVWMSGNHLTGELTENLSKLTKLEQLILDDNELTGTLPMNALGNKANLPNLKQLGLSGNKIRGTVPAGLASRLIAWPAMTIFRLNGNYLEGPIPKTFAGATGHSLIVNLLSQRDGVVLEIEK